MEGVAGALESPPPLEPNSSTQVTYVTPERIKAITELIKEKDAQAEERLREIGSKAMSIDLVMDKIAEKLPAGDLLTLRRTCAFWSSHLLPQLQKRHSPVRLGNRFNHLDIHDYNKVLQSSSAAPFKRYTINTMRAFNTEGSDEFESRRISFQKLVTKFGNTITKLTLDWHSFTNPSVTDFRRMVFELTPELKDLQIKLYLNAVTAIAIVQQGQGLSPQSSQTQLLTMLPKLRRLAVDISFTSDVNRLGAVAITVNPDFTQLLSDVVHSASGLECLAMDLSSGNLGGKFWGSTIEGLANLDKLKTLDTKWLSGMDLLKLIELAKRPEQPLKLTSFSTNVSYFIHRSEHEWSEIFGLVRTFLLTQTQTLQKLKLKISPAYRNREDGDNQVNRPIFHMPRMEHIKKLELECSLLRNEVEFDGDEESETRRSFMGTFPHLTSFLYKAAAASNGPQDNRWNGMELIRISHVGIVDLELRMYGRNCRNFFRYALAFPAVSRLDLVIDVLETESMVANFSKIWSAWPALTTIKIGVLSSEMFDSLMTGVPSDRLARLEKLKTKLESMSMVPTLPTAFALDSIRTTVNKYKTRPSVSDLQQLRELTISEFGSRDSPGMSELGVYFGIALASRSLQRLTLDGYHSHYSGCGTMNKLSEQCVRFLRSVFAPPVVINLPTFVYQSE